MAVAFLGLLIVDLTVFVLTIARSIRLWTRREPFLCRLFIDGAFYDIPIPTDEPTLRDHAGLLYYGYVTASWEPPLADHTVSVIWNLNLANIIVLLVRHFLSSMCFIILMPLCFAPPLGVTGKRGTYWLLVRVAFTNIGTIALYPIVHPDPHKRVCALNRNSLLTLTIPV